MRVTKSCASIILGVLGFLPATGFSGEDVQARFEKSLRAARSFSNIEIEMLDTIWIKHPGFHGPKDPEFYRTFEYSYVASGPKYRSKCKLVSASQTNVARLFESGFDGISYFGYDSDNRSMTLLKGSPRGDRGESYRNPLVAPFMFLSKESDDCPACGLRFTDISSPGFADGLRLPNGERVDGLLEIAIPGLPVAKQPTTWEIAFDEAGESFTPRTISRVIIGGGVKVVHRLLNYTNLGAYQFPMRIEVTQSAYPPTSPPNVLATGLTTVVSVRIPEEIADSVFKRDDMENAAAVVWDGDRKNFTKRSPELVKAQVVSRATRRVLLSTLFVTALIPILIVLAKRVALKNR